MANVFLSNEAYARLRAAKKPNQSFSDVVLERIPQEIDFSEFLGSCKGLDAKKAYAEIKKDRR
jgi:predicted CopG family antitoxin